MWYVLLAANLVISLEIVHRKKGETKLGPAKSQAVPVRPGVVVQESVVVNDVNNPACANNKVLSETSDSGIYVTGIANHRVTCIFLDTGATVSILNEGTWRKSGLVTKIVPVIRTLITANGNELTVLGETNIDFL